MQRKLFLIFSVISITLLIVLLFYLQNEPTRIGNLKETINIAIDESFSGDDSDIPYNEDNYRQSPYDDDKYESDEIKEEAVHRKIKEFTNKWFRFTKKIQIDGDNGKLSVFVSFMPEVGSFPVKQEIFQDIAYHALQISYFFPEVIYFKYHVLWDVWDPVQEDFLYGQEVITLDINEDAIKKLEENYYQAINDKNAGFIPDFNNVFSLVIEAEEVQSWRNTVDLDATFP